MIKFIEGNTLNLEIENIFKEASDLIYIISPFIKLHHRYKDILKTHLTNPDLDLVILFGKNDGDITKSISLEELEFFSTFPNVEIRYDPRLHAKYYANEYKSIITSMNLYDFSQNNNIEVGMLLEVPPRIAIGHNNSDKEAFEYFNDVLEKSELLFNKEPEYDEGIFGTGFKRKYLGSIITENKLKSYIKGEKHKSNKTQRVGNLQGHCIRCNLEIRINLDPPYCDKCFSSWGKYQNKGYLEKYCHICGKSCQTTFDKPVCYSCYKSNKTLFMTN